MDKATLTKIGLNDTQASAYITLIKSGSLTPPELVEKLKIKRTNAYAVLDQLTTMGLAKEKEVRKKLTYYPENPVALERLAAKKRGEALEQERKVQASMPMMLKYFQTFSDQPGIKFYQGINEIKEIYNDTLRTCKDIYLFRSLHDQDLLSTDYYIAYKKKRAQLGIKTHVLNGSEDTDAWNKKLDSEFNLVRTQIGVDDYTAPVEIAAYGNKVSIISFGEEAIGMIIDSPQIAESIKQIFGLVKAGTEASRKTSLEVQ